MFKDREEAGRELADRFRGRPLQDPLVLAIPRGGIATGAALARELNAELDVALSHKLRAPGFPELAIGAISETGNVYLNLYAQEFQSPEFRQYLDQECEYQLDEIHRRAEVFRGNRPPARIQGRSVIVTDDGIATGSTMIAALESVRAGDPHELIVAVPVAPPETVERLSDRCDEFVCLHSPEDFRAVGEFYENFAPVVEDEAVELLYEFSRD